MFRYVGIEAIRVRGIGRGKKRRCPLPLRGLWHYHPKSLTENPILVRWSKIPIPAIFIASLYRQFEKSFDGMRILHIEVRIIRRKHHVVLKTIFGNVFGGDFIAFYRAVALSLKVFQRRQSEIWVFGFACGLGVFAHAP